MLNSPILMRLDSVAAVYGRDEKEIGKKNFKELDDTWGKALLIVDFGYNDKGELRTAMVVTALGNLLEVENSHDDYGDPTLNDLLTHYYVDFQVPSAVEPMCTLCKSLHWGSCGELYNEEPAVEVTQRP